MALCPVHNGMLSDSDDLVGFELAISLERGKRDIVYNIRPVILLSFFSTC